MAHDSQLVKNAIYVGQYGGFWKLTKSQWLEVCSNAIKDGYDLSPYKSISKSPFLKKNTSSKGYYLTRNDAHYVEPLDWTKDDFVGEIAKLAITQPENSNENRISNSEADS